MTWIPCSYCSLVGVSPTPAKCPLTCMIEGAVGCLEVEGGRFSLAARCGERVVLVVMVNEWALTVPKQWNINMTGHSNAEKE